MRKLSLLVVIASSTPLLALTVVGAAETGAFQGKYDRLALEADCERRARGLCAGPARRVSEWQVGQQSLPLEPGWTVIRLRADFVCE